MGRCFDLQGFSSLVPVVRRRQVSSAISRSSRACGSPGSGIRWRRSRPERGRASLGSCRSGCRPLCRGGRAVSFFGHRAASALDVREGPFDGSIGGEQGGVAARRWSVSAHRLRIYVYFSLH